MNGMNLLALDTCFDACSVAAGRRLRSLTPSIAFASEPMATGHAERLMPMVESVMADAGMSFQELDRIAITIGPGTFTGARIAVSAGRALALATGATMVAVSSLKLMAMSPDVVAGDAEIIAIATDARRGEVYFQTFHPRTLQSQSMPELLTVERAAAALAGRAAVIAGSAGAAVALAANQAGVSARAICGSLLPEAIDMLFASLEWPVAARPAPLYLRPPDAKPPAPSPFAGPNAGPNA